MKILFLLCLSLTVQAQSKAPIPVTVKSINDILIERRLTANAEVQSRNNSTLSAEVSAVVQAIHVDRGDAVTKGDLLISLDETDIQLQLEQAIANTQAAQARLSQAELRLARANQLNENNYISADDLLARQTDVAILKADLQGLKVAQKIVRRALHKTRIMAPFDGVVSERQAQVGQLLSVGNPVISLVQTSEPHIIAKIPSQLATQLSRADRMLFSFQQQQIPVALQQLSDVIDTMAGIQTARFKPLEDVQIGQTGELVWYLKGQLLPADLVVKRAGQLGVFIAQDDKAHFKPLDHAQEGRPVPIKNVPDWQVIIGGRERLQHLQAISLK